MQKLKFMTSNVHKNREYSAMGLVVIDGDIDEVQGTPDEVIIHKALGTKAFTVVEDTIVVINGEPIVDWKYTYADHAKDKGEFTWQVRLAFHDGYRMYVYTGEIECIFELPDGRVPTAPHFDDYSSLKTLYQDELLEDLKKSDKWASVDPRSRAVYNLTWDNTDLIVPLEIIQPWDGEYQE